MQNAEEQKKVILDFFKRHKMAALATASIDGKPEVSMVDYSETPNLEIILVTLADYRKYRILQSNSKTAFAIGGQEGKTVQYEGEAAELSRQEFQVYEQAHIEKNPIEVKFIAMPQAKFFIVRPSWICYSDFTAAPNNIFEIKF